ncbi:predicted protein [Naegleria gruberi]|uniref:Predicted protein n=1 Tax=Naegleria gruberi TaxID=5762 RepID=D2UY27_NAEGR|nr:uncharacterized protein NAEGRDRAFT_61324 [Naegleria gruberi]EFC50398.1 predicted protein [Naegleria gruberi]|eukprot:XP_002683142.1 predicted protein [Naegleria gruberi strain NEG-M]
MKQTVDLCKEFPNLTQVHFVNHFPTLARLKSFILESLFPSHCPHLRVIDITSGELNASQHQSMNGGSVKQQVTPIQRLMSEEDFPVIVDYALLVLPDTASTKSASGAGGGGSGGSRYLKMNDEQTLSFLRQLIEKYHVPINTCIQGKYTFLSGACHNGHFECIKYLLNFGANSRKNLSKSTDSLSRSISYDLISYAESAEKEILLLKSQPNRAMYFSFKRNFCIAPLIISLKENIINFLLERQVSLCEYQIGSIIQHLRRSLANISLVTPELKLKILEKKKKQEQLFYNSLRKVNAFLFNFDDLDRETGCSPVHQILDYSSLRLIFDKMGIYPISASTESLTDEVIDIVNRKNIYTGATIIHLLCASSSSISKMYQPTSITELISSLSRPESSNLTVLDSEVFHNIQHLHNALGAKLDIYDMNGMMPIHLCIDMERYELAREWLKWKPSHALFLTKSTNESILHILTEHLFQSLFEFSASSSEDEGYRRCMNNNFILESPASPSSDISIPLKDRLEDSLLEKRRMEMVEKERENKVTRIISLFKVILTGLDLTNREKQELISVENDLGSNVLDMIESSIEENSYEEDDEFFRQHIYQLKQLLEY